MNIVEKISKLLEVHDVVHTFTVYSIAGVEYFLTTVEIEQFIHSHTKYGHILYKFVSSDDINTWINVNSEYEISTYGVSVKISNIPNMSEYISKLTDQIEKSKEIVKNNAAIIDVILSEGRSTTTDKGEV